MDDKYGVSLLMFNEEENSYCFHNYSCQLSKDEAEKIILSSPHGGYLIKSVPCVFHGIHTHTFVKAE